MQNPPSQVDDFIPHLPRAGQALAGVLASMWVALNPAMQALWIMMFFNFGTGMIAAVIQNRFHGRIAWHGLMRKGLTMWIVLMVKYVAHLGGTNTDVSSGIAMMFVIYEFSSGVQNCGRAGVPLPPPLVTFMAKLRQMLGNDSQASDNTPGKSSQVVTLPTPPPGSSVSLETQAEVVVIPPAKHGEA